jgi:hypothetical protein
MTTTKRSRYDPDGVPIPAEEMAMPVKQRLEHSPAVRERCYRLAHGIFDFQAVWKALAEQGVVPAVGRTESDKGFNEADAATLVVYRRVAQEWRDAGCPEAIGNFIRARVNR